MNAIRSLAGAAVLLLSAGCATMPVFPALEGTTFENGELAANVHGDIYETANAVREAGVRLQLAPVREVSDPVKARMVAFDPYGTRVAIRLIPVSGGITDVRIKAGSSGDEGYSRRILREILKNVP
jgi:hypothetical protein